MPKIPTLNNKPANKPRNKVIDIAAKIHRAILSGCIGIKNYSYHRAADDYGEVTIVFVMNTKPSNPTDKNFNTVKSLINEWAKEVAKYHNEAKKETNDD